jgi:hypothetical protein
MVAPAARAVQSRQALWVPITLHWSWESWKGFGDVEELMRVVGPRAASWSEFLDVASGTR